MLTNVGFATLKSPDNPLTCWKAIILFVNYVLDPVITLKYIEQVMFIICPWCDDPGHSASNCWKKHYASKAA